MDPLAWNMLLRDWAYEQSVQVNRLLVALPDDSGSYTQLWKLQKILDSILTSTAIRVAELTPLTCAPSSAPSPS